MAEYAIFWIANGFDPDDVMRTDTFSQACLRSAVSRYHALKAERHEVYFPIINSVVRDRSGTVLLRVTLQAEARNAGVDRCDMFLTAQETTGSPTDGLAIALFAKDHPRVKIEIFASMREAAEYFEVMYRAVARWIAGQYLVLRVCYPEHQKVTWKSRAMYIALRRVTALVAKTRFTFMPWYWLLNKLYERRIHGFTRTIR